MNKILVTGATGFVGRYLISKLNKNITLLVSRKKIKDFKSSIICDFETSNINKEILKGVETVFHLAGIAHDLKENQQTLKKYRLVNVEATKKLAETSAKSGVKKFVFLSSIRASKNQVNQTGNNYGFSKRCAEKLLLEISKNSNMKIAIIRSPLIYGPKSKGNLNVMYDAIKKGWFPPIPKDKGGHVMIHIDDLITCLLLVAKKMVSPFNIYYLSDGITYSARDIYNQFCQILNIKTPSWNVPWFIFVLLSLTTKKIRRKIRIIFGNYVYSSKKIKNLGFVPKKTLKDFNETDF